MYEAHKPSGGLNLVCEWFCVLGQTNTHTYAYTREGERNREKRKREREREESGEKRTGKENCLFLVLTSGDNAANHICQSSLGWWGATQVGDRSTLPGLCMNSISCHLLPSKPDKINSGRATT